MSWFNDATKMKILPMSRLTLTGPATGHIDFFLLESDSSWTLEPITQQDDRGGVRTVGWKLLATAIVPYNNYQAMLDDLRRLALFTPTDMDLVLKAQNGQVNGAEMWITMDSSSVLVHDVSVSWKVEGAEMRPRLSITAQTIMSRDAIEQIDFPLFTQIHGF